MQCESCGSEIFHNDIACPECGVELPKGLFATIAARNTEKDEKINRVILTTAPTLENHSVIETIEVVTAECVYGIDVFRDLLVDFTDFFGGRSSTAQSVLKDARRACLYELKKEAHQVGANAVIAVRLDYSEFSGRGKSMLFLVASGTAVTIKKIN